MRGNKNPETVWKNSGKCSSISSGKSYYSGSRKRACSVCLVLLLCIFACGCSKKDNESVENTDTVVEEQPLHQQTDSIVFDNKKIDAITPVCSMEESDDVLYVFPYFDSDAHIIMKRVYISENNLWMIACKEAKRTKNYVQGESKKYSYVSKEGLTLCYIPISEEEAYLLSTDSLPSSYVDLLAKEIVK